MKKLISLFCMITILSVVPLSSSALTFTDEEYNIFSELPLTDLGMAHLVQINSEDYIMLPGSTDVTMKYHANEYQFFIEQPKTATHYIWTGSYYFTRNAGMDPANSTFEWSKPQSFKPVRLYDKDFNLLKEYIFDGYVRDISFCNGMYYCYLPQRNAYGSLPACGERLMASADFENWTEVDGPMPKVNNSVIYKIESDLSYPLKEPLQNSISFGDSSFYPINYEKDNIKYTCNQFGNWIVKRDDENNFYFSPDDVYYVTVGTPENIVLGDIQYMYEYEGELVIIYNRKNTGYGKLTIPTQELYAELEAQKSAPYVCVNNTILGFETPPVTESDRTLVPMRFLFEQLGADVTWDEATETATAKKANTTINFSIDNTTATVNGTATTMDVPARLVGDKTMVPLRFLSEEMGYTVEWDEETRMATITTPLMSRMAKAETTDVFGEWIR